MARLERLAPWAPWLVLLAMVAPAALGVQLPAASLEYLERHGIGTVILLGAMAYVPRLLRAHQELAGAVQSSAEAVRRFAERDDYERREVLGVLTVLAEDMRDVKTAVRAVKDQLDGDGR